jgi:hypothetical protein
MTPLCRMCRKRPRRNPLASQCADCFQSQREAASRRRGRDARLAAMASRIPAAPFVEPPVDPNCPVERALRAIEDAARAKRRVNKWQGA